MTNWDDNRPGPGADASAEPLDHIDEWADLALDYIDGTAAPAEAARVEAHVADCPSCSARLQQQRAFASQLAAIPLVEAPEGLEDRILGEFLFPSQVPPALPEPEKAPVVSLWQRRLRAWVPAAAAVAAVFVGIVAYGLLSSSDDQEAADLFTTTTPTAAVAVVPASQDGMDPPANEGQLGSATTLATATETTAGGSSPSDGTDPSVASVDTPPATITSRRAMVDAMKTSSGPLYLALAPSSTGNEEGQTGDTTAADPSSDGGTTESSAAASRETSTDSTGDVAQNWMEQTVREIVQFTELLPLPESVSEPGPVFAAYLDHDHVSAFIDLMLSIANSIHLNVSMQAEPDADSGMATMIEQHKDDLPALLSHVIPQPAVVRYSFTTSTLVSPSGAGEEGASPDQAGTHVLTIVFLKP